MVETTAPGSDQPKWPAYQPWAALAGFAFLVHFVWEMWQAPFYRTMLQASHASGVATCTIATLGDAAITITAFAAAARRENTRQVLAHPPPGALAVYFATGLVITVALEWLNVGVLRRWSYAADMPTVLGIGMTPLLQWIVLPRLVLWLAGRHLCSPRRA
jgi:hypothetical protein